MRERVQIQSAAMGYNEQLRWSRRTHVIYPFPRIKRRLASLALKFEEWHELGCYQHTRSWYQVRWCHMQERQGRQRRAHHAAEIRQFRGNDVSAFYFHSTAHSETCAGAAFVLLWVRRAASLGALGPPFHTQILPARCALVTAASKVLSKVLRHHGMLHVRLQCRRIGSRAGRSPT